MTAEQTSEQVTNRTARRVINGAVSALGLGIASWGGSWIYAGQESQDHREKLIGMGLEFLAAGIIYFKEPVVRRATELNSIRKSNK